MIGLLLIAVNVLVVINVRPRRRGKPGWASALAFTLPVIYVRMLFVAVGPAMKSSRSTTSSINALRRNRVPAGGQHTAGLGPIGTGTSVGGLG